MSPATSNVTPASSRAPDAAARGCTIAICAVASLATFGIAGSSHYAGGASPPTGAARQAAGGDVALQDRRLPRVRLADSRGSWPGFFLDGLFGMPQQTESRRPPRPRVRRPPRRERALRNRKTTTTPSSPREAERGEQSRDTATYRTMCVRLCDGYYWPISFATGKDSFRRDSKACKKSCDSPAVLYYYPNPGGDLQDMVNLEGQPYTSLGSAFLYRAAYDANCKCRPHSWEAEATERHRGYAQQKRHRAAARSSRR